MPRPMSIGLSVGQLIKASIVCCYVLRYDLGYYKISTVRKGARIVSRFPLTVIRESSTCLGVSSVQLFFPLHVYPLLLESGSNMSIVQSSIVSIVSHSNISLG